MRQNTKTSEEELIPRAIDIERLLQRVESMKARHAAEFDGLVAEIASYLPRLQSTPRIQRIRAICSDPKLRRAVLRGELKI
jgi:hypothetical protein